MMPLISYFALVWGVSDCIVFVRSCW